jgi:PAS domain S-box-containing protein
MFVDTHARKQAEMEIADARQFLDALINAVPHPIFAKDRDHRFVLVNEAYCAMRGRSRAELLGRTVDDFVPAPEARIYRERDRIVFESGRTDRNEEIFTNGSGQVRTVVTHKALFRDSQVAKCWSARSPTSPTRKEASAAAERNRQFLDSLINALPTSIFVKDEQHRWVHVNDAFCRIYGVTREQVLGKDDAALMDPDTAAERFREDDRVLAGGVPVVTEQWQPMVDGSGRWGMKTKTPVQFPDGGRGVVGMFIDITERKAAGARSISRTRVSRRSDRCSAHADLRERTSSIASC